MRMRVLFGLALAGALMLGSESRACCWGWGGGWGGGWGCGWGGYSYSCCYTPCYTPCYSPCYYPTYSCCGWAYTGGYYGAAPVYVTSAPVYYSYPTVIVQGATAATQTKATATASGKPAANAKATPAPTATPVYYNTGFMPAGTGYRLR